MTQESRSTGRATIYARLSLDRTGDGESVDRQLDACRRYCDQHGWQVVAEHEDRDVSGFKDVDRPGRDAALEDIRARRANILVVWKTDRLTRQGIPGLWTILNDLKNADAHFVSVTEGFDTSTALGEGFLGLIASQAKQESENTSLRLKKAHESEAKNGKMHTGGSRSLGYNRDSTINEDEATIIRELAQRFSDGDSLRSMAIDLNRRGIKTTMGKQWWAPAIGHMLRSPKLRGYRTHNGELHKGNWEPILTEEEHLALLEKLGDSRRKSVKKGNRHLLTGSIRCGRCGQLLKYMPYHGANKIFPRYACVKQPGTNNCGKLAASMESVDATVREAIRRYLLASRLGDFRQPEDETPKLQALIEKDQEAVNELTKARYFERSITPEAYEDTKELLEQRLADTQRQLKEVERSTSVNDELAQLRREMKEAGDDPAFLERYMEMFFELFDPVRGRQIIARLIDYVEILPARRRGGNVFDPSRVVIHWKRPIPEKVLETIGSSGKIFEEAAKAGNNPWDALGVALMEADEDWFERWVTGGAGTLKGGHTNE